MLITALLKVPSDALAAGDLAGWVTCPSTGDQASIANAAELLAFLAGQTGPAEGPDGVRP